MSESLSRPLGDYQVPRLALAFLLVTQAILLLPHLIAFPLVLVPVWLVCTVWRLMIYRGQWGYPSSIIKAGLVFFTVAALLLVQRKVMAVETAILALLIAFLLKLLEMKQQRDVLVLVYLAYFVIVAQLLLSQDVISGIYLVVALLMVTATLIALRSATDAVRWFYPLQQAATMLALSIPIMLVAFLVFPRLEPLWTVPMPGGSGKTGVSGSMSPGQISRLAQSDALAFRAGFQGHVPPLKELYWRGIALTSFDGQTWLPLDEPGMPQPPLESMLIDKDSQPYRYRITMEPSQQLWMFVLAGVTQTDAHADYLPDFTLRARDAIDQRQSWGVVSFSQSVLGLEIDAYHHRYSLQLPKGFNPKAIALAAELYGLSTGQEEYIAKVLDYFREQPFFYTLSPPALGRDTVDDFLFVSRRGFCEHYASAFVVLMRAAGIPARVIAGYQGGDVNPYEKHVTVRQLDAHAWAEVWLPGKGWQRVDPTYAVAPERIEQGSEQSLRQEEGFLAQAPLSPIRYRELSWLRNLQYRFDQVNYLWHIWVLDYAGARQQGVLLALLGEVTLRHIAVFVSGVFLLFGLVLGGYMALRYRPQALSPVDRLYRRFVRKLAGKGLQKLSFEGPLDFAVRARARWPASAHGIDAITSQYVRLKYAQYEGKAEQTRLLKQFRRDVIKFTLQQ